MAVIFSWSPLISTVGVDLLVGSWLVVGSLLAENMAVILLMVMMSLTAIFLHRDK